jgi:pimeloyl-ACP methyl ester carboxylesterase
MGSERRCGRLVVHEYGDPEAPVLVLLHGITDSGQCWTDLVERLGSAYRIVAPDALGHGASDRFTDEELASEEPMEQMYAATADLLREVAPSGGVLLVGHSMGGGLAGALAAREPDLVRAVVLEDPAWRDERPRGEADELTRQRVADAEQTAAEPEAAIAQCRLDHPSWPASELSAWAAAKADVDLAFLRTGRGLVATPWREIATAIRRPALVVTGDHEVILHAGVLEEIAGLGNPALEVHVVPGAAHCVRRDQADAFHAAVDPWLAGHAR